MSVRLEEEGRGGEEEIFEPYVPDPPKMSVTVSPEGKWISSRIREPRVVNVILVGEGGDGDGGGDIMGGWMEKGKGERGEKREGEEERGADCSEGKVAWIEETALLRWGFQKRSWTCFTCPFFLCLGGFE